MAAPVAAGLLSFAPVATQQQADRHLRKRQLQTELIYQEPPVIGVEAAEVVDETDNTVQRREVSTGALTRFGIMLGTGISAGELVVISGANSLQESQEVRPVEAGETL